MRAGAIKRASMGASALMGGGLARLAIVALAVACSPHDEVEERADGEATQTHRPPSVPQLSPPPSDEDDCASCHPDVTAEWATSQHANAAVDPVFREALRSEPDHAFCLGCHASTEGKRDPTAQPSGDLEPGVGCNSCHERPHEEPSAAPRGACANCHEFAFPSITQVTGPEDLMQRTVTEHEQSPFAAVACATCHMHRDGHVSHRFSSVRDPKAHQRAVSVSATRNDDTAQIELALNGVGHAYPTGDLLRRIRIDVEAVSDDGQVRARATRYLGRELATDENGRRYERADNRLIPNREGAPTVVSLELDESVNQLRWTYRVQLERVVHLHPNGVTATVDSTVLLGKGDLLP